MRGKDQTSGGGGRGTGSGQGDRGQRASFDPRTGEVHGSGSGAGTGAHSDEDYDGDPMAGGGDKQVGGPRKIDDAAERPIDADEGI